MTPMDKNSTRFISLNEIKTHGIDLYEDAWGIFCDSEMLDLLRTNEIKPGKRITNQLIDKIRKQ
jgi:hypothetical protein